MKAKKEIVLPKIMTKQQVAAYFSVSTKTVERMMHEGLRFEKIRGKRYVREEWIIEYSAKIAKSAS